jgi:hypothetical protein
LSSRESSASVESDHLLHVVADEKTLKDVASESTSGSRDEDDTSGRRLQRLTTCQLGFGHTLEVAFQNIADSECSAFRTILDNER